MSRLVLSVLLLNLAACGSGSQPVTVAAGERVEGDLESVNGAVMIGEEAQVNGSLTNVNGSIEVGRRARVGEISNVHGRIVLADGASAGRTESVDGAIELGESVVVAGTVSAVNGNIEAGPRSTIQGDMRTVNGRLTLLPGARVEGKAANTRGKIELDGAFVESIETQAGSIDVMADATVTGKLWVREAEDGDTDVPRIVIGPGAKVGGPLQFDREVELLVHDDAEVGEIIGAEAQCFSCEIVDLL